MSCSVTERVSENRAGPAAGTGTAAGTAGCRLRGASTTSLATPPRGTPTAPQNGPQQGPPLRANKPCCLCWCCCCSCSWCNVCLRSDVRTTERDDVEGYHVQQKATLFKNCSMVTGDYAVSTPGKGSDENGPTRNSNNSDLLNFDGDPPPTLEEIRSWGRSFDRLMRSPAGRRVFRDFLRCEYSEENILFWLACEELKRENNPEVVEEKARIIYEDYISILSPKEVSLDSRVREIVNRNMVEPTPHTFDEAQLQIYTLMHRDSYPRFVNSQLYRTLAQQNSQNNQNNQGPSQDDRAPDQEIG